MPIGEQAAFSSVDQQTVTSPAGVVSPTLPVVPVTVAGGVQLGVAPVVVEAKSMLLLVGCHLRLDGSHKFLPLRSLCLFELMNLLLLTASYTNILTFYLVYLSTLFLLLYSFSSPLKTC